MTPADVVRLLAAKTAPATPAELVASLQADGWPGWDDDESWAWL